MACRKLNVQFDEQSVGHGVADRTVLEVNADCWGLVQHRRSTLRIEEESPCSPRPNERADDHYVEPNRTDVFICP